MCSPPSGAVAVSELPPMSASEQVPYLGLLPSVGGTESAWLLLILIPRKSSCGPFRQGTELFHLSSIEQR